MIMLKDAGIMFPLGNILKVVGTKVEISVEYDPRSRELPINRKLVIALNNDKQAQEAYEALAPYRKHEINRYLSFIKTKEKLELNVNRIIKHLKGEETDALYPLMHRKKQI